MATKRKKGQYADQYFVDFTLAGVRCSSCSVCLTKDVAEALAEECKQLGAADVTLVSTARGRLG